MNTPQVITGQFPRLRCQFLCQQQRQSVVCPPFSPTRSEARAVLEEYRFGVAIRKELRLTPEEHEAQWSEFHQNVLDAELRSLRAGYPKAFAFAIGNCVHLHFGDDARPCDFPGKTRPTLEAVGVNIPETLDLLNWDAFIHRTDEEPFQMLALLLLE